MTQEELLLYEIERRGGSINTYELRNICCQYQARLFGLRRKLAEKGIILTEGEPVKGLRRCFSYRLIKPPVQTEMFN